MKREKAYLPEDEERAEEIVGGSKDEDWSWIQDRITSSDLEKGMEYVELILKRKSDERFFKFEVPRTSQHSLYDLVNRWPIEGTEVFPEVITTTIYK